MDLVRIELQSVYARVIPVLEGHTEILACYLFGSALGECRPDSDIDLGLFFYPDLDFRRRMMIEGELALQLTPIENHVFDLTLVDPENTLFAFRVLHEGALLFVRDRESFSDLIEKISRDYAERSYRYRMAIAEIAEEVKSIGD